MSINSYAVWRALFRHSFVNQLFMLTFNKLEKQVGFKKKEKKGRIYLYPKNVLLNFKVVDCLFQTQWIKLCTKFFSFAFVY